MPVAWSGSGFAVPLLPTQKYAAVIRLHKLVPLKNTQRPCLLWKFVVNTVCWSIWSDLGRVQQLTTLIGRSIGPAYVRPVSYDSYHRYPIEQSGSDSLPAGDTPRTVGYLTTDSVFYWLTKIYVYRSETLTTHYKYFNSQIQPNSNCEHDVTWPGARESAFALTIDPWNLAMAASCPTADRSRKWLKNVDRSAVGHAPVRLYFCRAMLWISAAYAVMRCMSICLSVCQIREFCRNW